MNDRTKLEVKRKDLDFNHIYLAMETLRLTLDWTPNTNHSGFYVGLHEGWYFEAGINLEILYPSEDYTLKETPARRVVNGVADLCIAPSESVISCWTSEPYKTRPVAVAAVLQDDTSAIVSLMSGPVQKLSDLDDHRYASYGGRFEMNIVKQAVQNDGGKGNVIELVPPKLDCFDHVLRGDSEATWVFTAWEGLMATKKGILLNEFPLKNSRVPYGYSPSLLAHPSLVTEKSDLLRRFLKVTARGYQYCVTNPHEAAAMLLKTANHPTLDVLGLSFLEESQALLARGDHIITKSGTWGEMR